MFIVGIVAFLGLLIRTTSPFIAFVWSYAFFDGNLQATMLIILSFISRKSTLAEGFTVILMASSIPMMLGPPITGE